MKIDLSCPVENRGAAVKVSTKTNEVYALLKLFNLSDSVVTGVEFDARVFDTYGKELGVIPVVLTDIEGQPKDFFAQNKAVVLDGFTEAKHIVPEFKRVIFEDGTEYEATGELLEVSLQEPDAEEGDRLKEAAGEDAACYAKDPGEYWICVCGRVNTEDETECIRCGRDKETVLNKFSSRHTVDAALEEKRVAADRAELERFKALEAARAENKKKTLKGICIGAIGVACLAVLCVIGYFSYGFIVTQIANGYVKGGNYMKAYSLYSSVNSSSVGKASEYVRGNSASNLSASGILAEDGENYYYINGAMKIVIENKQSKEKKETAFSGLSLNAVDGQLYFLNMEDSYKIFKMDAKTGEAAAVEALSAVQAYSLSVVGNDIYYIAAEAAGAGQTQQGQQPQQIPVLYNYREGSKAPVKVSAQPIQTFQVYKGKVYFTGSDQTQTVYSISKPGAEPEPVLEGPIGLFEIKDDTIYYLDYTTPAEGQGIPNLSINTADMKGTFIAKLTADDVKAAGFSVAGDKIYFNNYSDSMKLYSMPLAGGEAQPAGEQMFNVLNTAGEIAVGLTSNGEMMKMSLTTGETESLGELQQ